MAAPSGCTRVGDWGECREQLSPHRLPHHGPSIPQLAHNRKTLGQRPNGLAYDPTRRHLYAFNIGDPPGQNCTASVVALDQMLVVRTIPLPGRPRWAIYDAATDQVFANIQNPPQIV